MKLSDLITDDAASSGSPQKLSSVTREEGPSVGERFAHGFADPYEGMAQLAAHGGMALPPTANEFGMFDPNSPLSYEPPPKAADIDKTIQNREADYQARRKAAGQTGIDWARGGGELVSGIAMTAPLGVVAPEAAGASLLGRMGTAAALGGLGGAVTGATEPVMTKDGFGKEKLKQIGIGAGTGAVLGGGLGALSKAMAPNTPAEVNDFVKRTFQRAVAPTIRGKSSDPRVESYYDKVRDALTSIIKNKSNLRYVDDKGVEIVGRAPESLEQFGKAISQTKLQKFAEYDAMKKAAGEAGALIDLTPMADKIDKLATSKVTQIFDPSAADYAKGLAERIRQQGKFTTDEAQEAVEKLNKSLTPLYRGTAQDTGVLEVKEAIASDLREAMDNAITNEVGPGYQQLRNEYGSLKTIEKEVVDRAQIVARQQPGGGLLGRVASVASWEEMLRGLWSHDMKAIGTGAGIKAMTEITKYLRSPDRAIRQIFRESEAALNPASSAIAQASMIAAPLAGMAGTLGITQPTAPMEYTVRP